MIDSAMAISTQSIEASAKFDEVRQSYECHDHQHAVAVLTLDFPELFIEICDVLLTFHILVDEIKAPGGNESAIPKKVAELLRPKGWIERKLEAKQVVDDITISVDTHKVDFVKGEVAFDLEWNSKDQTFDRDLLAFKAFFEYKKIAVAVLLTRSTSLEKFFKELGKYQDERTSETKAYKDKFGASTTHIDKLLPRLVAGRSAGCPVLAIGITSKQIES